MYSAYNERKSVVAEWFMRTLKNKIYKHMANASQNVYFDVLDDIVDKYNNTYHRAIKTKEINVKPDSFGQYNVDSNDKDPKFKIGEHVRISKYKKFFTKVYAPNWSDEVFEIKKIKNTVPWTYVTNDLNSEEVIWMFYEKELPKSHQKNLE